MTDVRLRGIRKSYGRVEVLHGIDLDVRSGEFVVFVGPSGCGKSTLLRIIAGLEETSGGGLDIGGQRVNEVPPSRRGIAMVFQSYALYPHMSVYDNMAFGMRIARAGKDEIDRRVRQSAEMLQLTPYLARLPRALSGGQRQRVAIGRAIVRDPKVFLFDEPLSNLDAALRVATRLEIARLKERMPETTMIYVTHDQVEAMTLADRIVVMNHGRIEQVGTPLELYRRPGNLFVARFIGSPAMNIVPVRLDKAGSVSRISLPGGRAALVPVATGAEAEGRELHFGVRPENLAPAEGEDCLFEGRLDYIEQLGEVQLLYVDAGGADGPLIVKLPGSAETRRGETLRLTAAPEDLHLFDADGRSLARSATGGPTANRPG